MTTVPWLVVWTVTAWLAGLGIGWAFRKLTERDEHLDAGRCGQPTPNLGLAGARGNCMLLAGHRGWHKDDEGCEWTAHP